MKKINIHFGRLAAAFVMGFCLVFSGCSNLIENIEENEKSLSSGKAKITLFVGLKDIGSSETDSAARTVMAKADDNKDASTLTEIKFYSKLSSGSAELGSSDTLLASWETYKDMQLSPYSEDLDAGTYDFMLTAKNYGATMVQTISGRSLAAGSKTALNFTSLTADPNGAQTGIIDVTLTHKYGAYSVDEKLKKYVYGTSEKYPAISIALDGELIATRSSTQYEVVSKSNTFEDLLPDDNGNTYKINKDTSYFHSAPIAAGYHLLTFTFIATDDSVFVYPLSVFVEAGYLSKNTYDAPFSGPTPVTQEAQTANHKVTYNSNTSSAENKTQNFYSGSSIADAEALGFVSDAENKRFKEWNTAADGSGISYKAGATPELDGDLTLYAQWSVFYKVTYLVNLTIKNSNYQDEALTDTYIQKFEEGSTLVSDSEAFQKMEKLTYSTSLGGKHNYTFCGWDTKADGSGTRYAEGAKPDLTGDLVLYAQWCGEKVVSEGYPYSGYYEISNVSQWNALMGAPFANTSSGVVTADVYLVTDSNGNVKIESPAISLTKGKTFNGKLAGSAASFTGLSGVLFDKLAEDSEIDNIKINGPVCNTNNGTIKSVTVGGVNMTGWAAIAKENGTTGTISNCSVTNCTITGMKKNTSDPGYVGAVCNINEGTITDCTVKNCVVDGETYDICYTGGICGQNLGTISGDSTKVTGTVKGNISETEESYTGGYCGYNSGTIAGKGIVNITLSGSDADAAYYGYVIGKNASGKSVSTEITTDVQEVVKDTGIIEVDSWCKYQISLTRTSLVTVTFTDTDKNNSKIDGYFTTENTTDTPTKGYALIVQENIDNSSYTGKKYLEKGTYYLYLTENTAFAINKGCSAKVIID